ncbi:MAG: tetratricopeptide repeat protein [Fusobacteriaceae bacterium]
MKGKILLISLLLMTGCTSLNDFMRRGTDKSFVVSEEESQGRRLVQNNINLNNGGSKIVLNTLKKNWSNNTVSQNKITENTKKVDLYAGETLLISDPSIISIYIVGKKVPDYQLVKRESSYRFRSLFQNQYTLKINRKNKIQQTLVVNNILNYKFEKQAAYDAIRNSYNFKRYNETISSIDLYTIAYPNDTRENELNVLLFNVFVENSDYDNAVKKMNNLKKITNFSESDITSLFKGELKISNYNLNVDDYYIYYTKKYEGFAQDIIKYLKTKTTLSERERQHLLSEGNRLGNEELKRIATENKDKNILDLLNPFTKKDPVQSTETSSKPVNNLSLADISGQQETVDVEKTPSEISEQIAPQSSKIEEATVQLDATQVDADQKYYDKGRKAFVQNRYDEAIIYFNNIKDKTSKVDINYYLGNSYFIVGDYDKAIENYKKYVDSTDESIRKGESLHNIGMSYEKKNDNNNSILWHKKTINDYPGTTWARKSNIAIVKIKNKK